MNKVTSVENAANIIQDGMTVMVGGFLGLGTAHRVIDAILDQGTKDLTLITSDTGFADFGVGKLITERRCRKLLVSHIGTNVSTVEQFNRGELEVEFIPQGTFTRRIHCGGSGLGGFLTKVGLGTVVEQGKTKITVDGEEYLLERPLRADAALVGGEQADRFGNMLLKGSGKNFNTVIAMAADRVIAEVGEIVECGKIAPSSVHIPGIFITHVVQGE